MAESKVGDYFMKPIYLDNAASTKVDSDILAKFTEVAERLYGNPSSKHKEGNLANDCIEMVKKNISSKIHCDSEDIFFTSGATMSNQLIIQGFLAKHPNAMIITTNVEHNDIMLLINNLLTYRHILNVDKNGLINLDELTEVLRYSTEEMKVPTLVSIQMANSETGIIQPIQKIVGIVKKYDNAFLHMDATQYIPYYPINMECWGIDAISMSGQKIGGIKGSGLLVARQVIREHIKPIIWGEQGLVGGTYPTPLIASLGAAFDKIDYNTSPLQNKRDYLLSCLEDMDGILIGTKENRLPNNIYIRFPKVNGLTLMNLLNDRDIYVGTGSACSTDSDEPSHVAKAYGLSNEEAMECIRFTLSNETTYEEMEYVVKVLRSLLSLLN